LIYLDNKLLLCENIDQTLLNE